MCREGAATFPFKRPKLTTLQSQPGPPGAKRIRIDDASTTDAGR